jgi:hypothetical protein
VKKSHNFYFVLGEEDQISFERFIGEFLGRVSHCTLESFIRQFLEKKIRLLWETLTSNFFAEEA